MSDDTSRLAFTWLVSFADVEGRTYGDPAIVRSMLFPRREDVTITQMEGYIREWHNAGLIHWYKTNDDDYIFFCGFDKNQKLRKDREAQSTIPAPPEEVRSIAGALPEQIQVKLKEVKLKEINRSDKIAIFKSVTLYTPDYETERKVVERIDDVLLNQRQLETRSDLIGYLKPFYDQWCDTRTKDGRKYNHMNPDWLNWAIKNDAPEKQAPEGKYRKDEESGGLYV